MSKRIVSSLLSLCLIVALLPAAVPTASAATAISKVVLTVTAPVAGQKPQSSASLSENAHSTVQAVQWRGTLAADGTFQKGTAYSVVVTLGIKSGANYVFSSKDKGINATVNGKSASYNYHAKDKIEVFYTFAAADNTLTEANLTLSAPEVGKTPATTATVKGNDNLTVKSVTWSGTLKDGKFQAGVEYTANITLNTKNGVKFSDSVFDATVNGDLIDAATLTRVSDTELIVPVMYNKLSGSAVNVLTEANITITAPEVGKVPSTKATLKAADGCYVKSVAWVGTLSDKKFKAGVAYTANIRLGIKSGSNAKFSDSVFDATVNGVLIDASTLTRVSDTELLVPVKYETLAAVSKTTTLTTAHITLTAPEIGKTPAKTASVPSSDKCYVKNVTWLGELKDGKFQAGKEYTATVTLGIRSTVDAKFSDSVFDAIVNNDTIDAKTLTRISDKELIVPVMYSALADSTPARKPMGGFNDVFEGDYFASPVVWAVDKKITSGTGEGRFSPNVNCSQAEILTFLWRAAGSPQTHGTVQAEGFTGNEYYYQAALWAVDKDIISEGDFNPDEPCTRAMAVTYMWKHAGSPSATPANFSDVSSGTSYAPAVAWAVGKGVTNGTGNNKFSPRTVCTRAQIVSFLYRGFAA